MAMSKMRGQSMPQPQTPAAGINAAGMTKPAGFFSQPMTPERQKMIMALVQAGMSSAAGSGSPMAAFLAPLAGGLIGRGVMNKADQYAKTQGDESMRAVLGPLADDPAMQGYIEVANNPNASDLARSIAQEKIKAATKPGLVARTGRSSSGGTSAARMMAEALARAASDASPGGREITAAERSEIDYLQGLGYAPRTQKQSAAPDPNDPLGRGAADPLGIR